MRVEQTIIKLLYKHDCVIVPNFGGFVAKNKPATFHPMDYTFNPPSKKIGFNNHLTNTDGLLAHAIAKDTGLDYDDANAMIVSKVNEWNSILKDGGSFELDGVGTFSLKHNHLNFEANPQQNFSIESYGLNSLKGQYIIRDSKDETSTTVKTTNSWISYAAAVAFALLVGGSSYFANEKLVQPQLSSVFPLLNANEQIKEESQPIAPTIEINNSFDTKPNLSDSNSELVTNDVKVIDTSNDLETNNANALDLSVKTYQVIGGSFKVYSRAMEHQAKLKRDGYDRAVIIGKVGNFYMVAFDTFNDYEDAIAYKRELEKQGHDVFMRP